MLLANTKMRNQISRIQMLKRKTNSKQTNFQMHRCVLLNTLYGDYDAYIPDLEDEDEDECGSDFEDTPWKQK